MCTLASEDMKPYKCVTDRRDGRRCEIDKYGLCTLASEDIKPYKCVTDRRDGRRCDIDKYGQAIGKVECLACMIDETEGCWC